MSRKRAVAEISATRCASGTGRSPTELQVMLDENLLKKAGRFDVQVINPEPLEKSVMGQRRFRTRRICW